MKVLKYSIVAILSLMIISIIGGYFYFNRMFTPPPNALTITDDSDSIPFTWYANEVSPIAALYLPVKIRGIDKDFYMQFDLGSPSTFFYSNSIKSIQQQFPNALPAMDSTGHLPGFSFSLGKINISSSKFKTINYGDEVEWNDKRAAAIGTIGADLIEKKIAILNFKNNFCYFGNQMPEFYANISLLDFDFEKRKVLLPAIVNGKKLKLLYDSGTSGFEFLTSRKIWLNMSKSGAKPVSYQVNSWGNSLTAHDIKSNKSIDFGMCKINLKKVTYIEGATFLQTALMRVTGMGGMIGNKLFINKVLILDCRNEKFGIL